MNHASHGFDSPVLDLPPVPKGVALSGDFMRCMNDECRHEKAREGWKGKNRIALCPKCLAGYGKPKQPSGGVTRSPAPGAAASSPEAKLDRDALARSFRELKKISGFTNAQMIEAMNETPDLGVVFKPLFANRLAPTMINAISGEWLQAMKKALDHVEAHVNAVEKKDTPCKAKHEPPSREDVMNASVDGYTDAEIKAVMPGLKMLVFAHRMGIRCRISMDEVVIP